MKQLCNLIYDHMGVLVLMAAVVALVGGKAERSRPKDVIIGCVAQYQRCHRRPVVCKNGYTRKVI